MADTSVSSYKGNFIEVTFTGAGADWDSLVSAGIPAEIRSLGRLKVKSISFVASNSTDHCRITEKENGPAIFDHVNSATQYYGDEGTWMRPFFDLSASTLNTAANAKISVELA